MRIKKSFETVELTPVATTPIPDDAGGAVVRVPENPTASRNLDLASWLGRGLDEWVWACAAQLRTLLASRSVQPSTVVNYWNGGLVYFFDFLVATGAPCQPASFERRHLDTYIAWLNEHVEWSRASQKTCYTATKPVLLGLQRRGVIRAGDLFPSNPFPRSNSSKKGQSTLSPGERIRLAEALRDDLVAIHHGRFTGTGSESLCVHVLALALRTGLNPTPLLEMQRDCLKPHPFMPNMMRVDTFKRRGNATQLKNLRYSKNETVLCSIPMDGVALLRMVLKLTEPLVEHVPANLRDRLWLYQIESKRSIGKLTVLTKVTLNNGIAALVSRHDLRDDADDPLKLNLSRLRKTLENRLWVLSNGDLLAVAAIMGHTPQVADTHYLSCTNEMRENATFVGEALPDIYRNGAQGDANGKVIPIIQIDKTPVGRCKDPINGDKALKDGTPCDDFLSCFGCRSYAIVGSPQDLHRLFSFYWFLEREKHHARDNDWRERFHNTMRLIDVFTLDKFDTTMVTMAKDRARVAPHIFWKAYSISPATGSDHGSR